MDDTDYNQPNKNWLDGYVYVLDYGDQKTFKIGHTTKKPRGRLKQITHGLPIVMPKVELVFSVRTNTNCRYLEDLLHMYFDSSHAKGEWFNLRFTDLLEIYSVFYRFGPVEVYSRWYELVPEDAILHKDNGGLSWINSLPHFSKEEEAQFENDVAYGMRLLIEGSNE